MIRITLMTEYGNPTYLDLKSLQVHYQREEQKALAEHYLALRSGNADQSTSLEISYCDFAKRLLRVNRELARREYEHITTAWVAKLS